MEIIQHTINNKIATEVVSDKVLIASEQDALDLMMNIKYKNHSDVLILHKHNFFEDFFDLKTGVAGVVLQKFINYQMGLVVLGNFENIKSQSLKDFIYETNKSGKILFVSDMTTALKKIV